MKKLDLGKDSMGKLIKIFAIPCVVIMLYSSIIVDILAFITALVLLKLEFKKISK